MGKQTTDQFRAQYILGTGILVGIRVRPQGSLAVLQSPTRFMITEGFIVENRALIFLKKSCSEIVLC